MSRENSAPADTGSSTLTQTGNPSAEARDQAGRAGPSEPVVGVLKLRGDRPARRQKVVWSEGTVDNEGMGKKKSKSVSRLSSGYRLMSRLMRSVCCIYHKPKAYDQSSDESSSDESECGHHHGLGKQGGAATRRKAPNVGGSTEQSESSESEGGAGDGRAKWVTLSKDGSESAHEKGLQRNRSFPRITPTGQNDTTKDRNPKPTDTITNRADLDRQDDNHTTRDGCFCKITRRRLYLSKQEVALHLFL